MKRGTALSVRELRRLDVLRQLESGTITAGEAAGLLEISGRQLRRLRAAYRAGGAVALAHGNRGRRPNNAIDPDIAERILELATTSYPELTLSRMTVALTEHHGIDVSRASLHRILKRAAVTGRAARAPDGEPDAAES